MHRNTLLFVVLLGTSCSGTPASSAVDPPAVTEPMASTSESKDPAASKPAAPLTAVPTGPAICHEFVGNNAIEQWRAQLIAAVSQRDDAKAIAVLRCVDPDFAHPLFDEVEEWLAVANPRQLDNDADEEWVLELRQHSPIVGDGERYDLVWLAVLDKSDGRFRLAGVISRAKVRACLIADDQGVMTEFSSEEPSAEAAMLVTEQQTKSCNRVVDVSYTKTQHRIEGGKLVATLVDAPRPKKYKR